MTTKKRPKLSLGTLPPKAKASTPAVDESTAAAFAEGQKTPRPPGRPRAAHAKHREWRKATFYLPPKLAEELAVAAIRQRRDMSDIIVAAVLEHLGLDPKTLDL